MRDREGRVEGGRERERNPISQCVIDVAMQPSSLHKKGDMRWSDITNKLFAYSSVSVPTLEK